MLSKMVRRRRNFDVMLDENVHLVAPYQLE